MNRGVVVIDAADHGCAVRWFVGVITATTKRASTDPRPGSAGGRLPVEGAGLVGKFVTAHGESWPCATPTDLCRQRGVVGNAGCHEWRRAL
jgi:hypothetical protein